MSLAELRPHAASDDIPSAAELVGRARALAPRLRERALRAERDRNIPQESVDEYIASQPEVVQGILRRVRSTIRKALPR